jgi:pathogenesis-related protein 1
MKVAIVLFTLFSILLAQSVLTSEEIQAVLDVHNEARGKVCLGKLEWDEAAAAAAQQYIDNRGGQCPSDHSSQSSRDASYKSFGGVCADPAFKYCSTAMLGENIASGSIGYYSAAELATLWVDEKSDFACGKLPSFQSNSGHYSQIVWSGTTKVGCGIRDCPDGFTTLLCNYYPPGNFNSGSTLAFPAANCNEQCNNVPTPTPDPTPTPTPVGPRTRVIPTPTAPQVTRSQSPSTFGSLSSNWAALMGTFNDWSLSSSVLLNHAGSTFSALTLSGSKASTDVGTDVFIVADINPGSSSKYGMAINVKSGNEGLQFHSFKYDGGKYKICYAFAGRPYYDCCGTYKDVPQHGLFKMRHTIVGTKHYYRGYIGDKALSTYILDNTWGGGEQGITALGDASFNSFYVRTPSSVKLTLNSCSMSTSDITKLVASQLGIDSGLIAGVQKLGCSKKRDTQVAESVSVLLVGSESFTSLELANKLISNPGPQMSSVSIEASTISDVIAEAGSAIALEVIPLTSATTGLSIGAIAGIAAGSAVGAVAIGVGIYFATKSKGNTQPKNNDIENQETKPTTTVVINEPTTVVSESPTIALKPPVVKGGIDVFNLDPNNKTSITARNHNIVLNTQNVQNVANN